MVVKRKDEKEVQKNRNLFSLQDTLDALPNRDKVT